MLRLDGEQFAIGRSRFSDRATTDPERTAKIYIKVVPGDLGLPILAQLDTGSPWSVLDPEIAETLGLLEAFGIPTTLSSRLGRKDGKLVKVALTLPADEGESVTVDQATVFVSEEWPRGKNFLGYGGFIESIRTALDPQENLFYFGGYDMG